MPIDWPIMPEYAAALVFGYLCGSIPFGILLTRLAGAPDLRSVGSGNIGATNVLRTGRKGLAAATLLGDMLKGTAAVLIVHHFFGRDAAIIAAAGAFLGHLFPVWLRFRGGKGVATYIGLLLGFKCWIALAAFCVIWARDRGSDALFIACGAGRERSHACGLVVEPQHTRGGAVPGAHRAALDHAPRQYRTADERNGKQDRPRRQITSVIARSQRVRPEVAGPMTGSATKQSSTAAPPGLLRCARNDVD